MTRSVQYVLLLGVAFRYVVVGPLLQRGVLPLVISTIALSIILKETVKDFYSAEAQVFPTLLPDRVVTLLPGIAVSHYHKRGQVIDWDRAAAWVLPVLRDLLGRPLPAGSFWNINLPHLGPGEGPPEVVFCAVDPGPLPLSFRLEGDLFHYNGDYHQRRRMPGGDVDVCFGGRIAVSRVALF